MQGSVSLMPSAELLTYAGVVVWEGWVVLTVAGSSLEGGWVVRPAPFQGMHPIFRKRGLATAPLKP